VTERFLLRQVYCQGAPHRHDERRNPRHYSAPHPPAVARKTTRSAFIRDALEAEIRRQRIREDEARHAEGYARKPVTPGEFDVWVNEQDWGAS